MSAELGLFKSPYEHSLFNQKMNVLLRKTEDSPLIQEGRSNMLMSKAVLTEIGVHDILSDFAETYINAYVMYEDIDEHFIDYKHEKWLPPEVISDKIIKGYAINWVNPDYGRFYNAADRFYRIGIAITDAKKIGVFLQHGQSNSSFVNRNVYDSIQHPESPSIAINGLVSPHDSTKEIFGSTHIPLLNYNNEIMVNGYFIDGAREYLNMRLDRIYTEEVNKLFVEDTKYS